LNLLSTSAQKTLPVLYLIIIVLPFLLLYWLAPFVTDLTIGKDYQEFSIRNQMELLFSVKTGSFPLYVPGFALGHSSSALTVGQVYHPISHIAYMLPGYWNGKALEWNTFLRLLSLGLTHLSLYVILRKLSINILFSFLLSCITIYNLRMLDLFRFGASLETYTGFLLLCTAIIWYFIQPSKWIGPLSITGATYWLVCSGHPTMMYYALIGAGLFLPVSPFFLSNMLPNKQINHKDALIFCIKVGFYIIIGISLSSAYILTFYFDFLSVATTRTSLISYDASTLETFFGTLSNFFMPYFSDVHYAFGGSSLFLIAAILPILRFFKVKIPHSVWMIWGLLLFAFLYMQGPRTPVHKWAWEYLPFVSSIRGAGRISFIIPFLIMLLLSWVIRTGSFSLNFKDMSITLTPYMLLALISLFLISLYAVLAFSIKPGLGAFTPKYINDIPLEIILIATLFGTATLISLICYNAFPHLRNMLGIILCLATCLHIGFILRYGTFVAERYNQPTFDQVMSQKKLKLDYRYHPGFGMYSSVILNQLNRSFIDPFLGKIFTEVIAVSSQDEAYESMAYERLPQQIFIEKYNPQKAKAVTENAKNMKKGLVNLVYSSFNRLQFRVYSEAPAIFGLSYPYTGHWSAWLDGNKVTVYRSNGAAHAIEIPVGESLVDFRFWSPAAFWGVVISCATFILIGLYVCLISFNGLLRVITVVLVLVVGVGSTFIWNHSLYAGDNLGTNFTWTYIPPNPEINLAYGKKTSISPLSDNNYSYGSNFYRSHSSRIVDGDKSPGSGFILRFKDNPAVIIDLYTRKEIDSITFFESIKESSENKQHLTVSISQDKIYWDKVASLISKVNNHDPLYIEFDSPKTARYIKLKTFGYDSLSLDEVEVYGK
jgi:hypothetical protein